VSNVPLDERRGTTYECANRVVRVRGIGGTGMQYLNDLVAKWGGDYTKLLGYILAVATFTMALLQLINDLSPFRAFSHMFLVRSWIRARVRLYKEETTSSEGDIKAEKALGQLIANATGGHWRALFGLPPPQLVAQINAAAQGALDNPQANYALIAVLSQPDASRIPFSILRKDPTTVGIISHLDDLKQLLDPPVLLPVESRGEMDEKQRDEARQAYEKKLQNYANIRALIAHRIQRNLDGMQIALTNTGATVTQLLAILIAVGTCYLFALDSSMSASRARTAASPDAVAASGDAVTSVPITNLLSVLLIGISAGYVALVLGDIVAAIRRFGRAP
jgi:hypothetical protein